MKPLIDPINTSDGKFHGKDKQTGDLATIVTPEYMNNDQDATRSMQREIISILTAAGINPEEATDNQLLLAIRGLSLQRKNPFGDIKTDGSAAIATALANLDLERFKQSDSETRILSPGGKSYIYINNEGWGAYSTTPPEGKMALPISAGGTGATTVAGALENLGLGDLFFHNLQYPVGSEFRSYTDNRNPADILGFGTWQPVVGLIAGVGTIKDSKDFEVTYAAGQQTGSFRVGNEHIIAEEIGLAIDSVGDHTHEYTNVNATGTVSMGGHGIGGGNNQQTSSAGGHGHTGRVTIGTDTATSGAPFLNPYYGCYIWTRTE